MRRRRRALTPAERARAAESALAHFQSLIHLRPGLKLAVYLSVNGEFDTAPLVELARRRGCRIYAPVLPPTGGRLRFVPLEPPLKTNRYGIPEPHFSPEKACDPRALDVVITPLVAFGPNGERLGSGAGYYDQTFAFLRRRRVWRKPRLIGLAYAWQQVEDLESEAWDVPLAAVVTDQGAVRFGTV